MIERVPAVAAHLDTIFSDPSDFMKQDIAALCATNPHVDAQFLRKWFASTLPDPDAETVLVRGVPVGTIGWEKADNIWYSWSATSPVAYNAKRPVFVLLQKRFFRDVAERNPGITLRMKPVIEVTDKMIEWMGLLGFAFCPEEEHFEYVTVYGHFAQN